MNENLCAEKNCWECCVGMKLPMTYAKAVQFLAQINTKYKVRKLAFVMQFREKSAIDLDPYTIDLYVPGKRNSQGSWVPNCIIDENTIVTVSFNDNCPFLTETLHGNRQVKNCGIYDDEIRPEVCGDFQLGSKKCNSYQQNTVPLNQILILEA